MGSANEVFLSLSLSWYLLRSHACNNNIYWYGFCFSIEQAFFEVETMQPLQLFFTVSAQYPNKEGGLVPQSEWKVNERGDFDPIYIYKYIFSLWMIIGPINLRGFTRIW